MKTEILRFWAKTTHDAENYENAFYPLVCHLIDVATSAQARWEKVLPEITKRRLARSFDLKNDFDKVGI
jgi:hypothetical protein